MRLKAFLTAASVSLALATFAGATTVGTVTLAGHNNAYSGTAYISGDGYSNVNVYTGLYSWTKTGYTGEGKYTPNWGYCVDIPQNPGSPYNVDDDIANAPVHATAYPPGGQPMGPQKAALIEELFGRYFQWTWVQNPGLANSRDMNEILGISIWEIVYEAYQPGLYDVRTDNTGLANSLADGGFYVNQGADWSTANTWLNSLNGTGPKMEMRALISSTYQDFLYPIPEPLTMLGVFLGVGGLGGYVRRRFTA